MQDSDKPTCKGGDGQRNCLLCGTVASYASVRHSASRGAKMKVLPLCNACWFWLDELIEALHIEGVDELNHLIRRLCQPQTCRLCNRRFRWLTKQARAKRELPLLPSRHIEICPRCVSDAIFGGHCDSLEPEQLDGFRRLAELLGDIPNRGGWVYSQTTSLETAVELTRIMHSLPPIQEMEGKYGSWHKLLVASGILPDGTRPTMYGTRVVAKDGDECLSLAEKSIDDLLYENGIPHTKEPSYPNSSFRADWGLSIGSGVVLVEFFGLVGNPDYEARMAEKIALAKREGLELVSFLPEDFEDLRAAFKKKVLKLYERGS